MNNVLGHGNAETKPNPPMSTLDDTATHDKYGGNKISVESLNPVLQDLHHQVMDREGKTYVHNRQ